MAHVVNNPADTQTIAAGPADIRAEIAKVANDQVTNAGQLNGLASGNGAGQIPVSNGVKNVGLNAELHGGNLPSAYATAGHGHAVATGSSDGFESSVHFNKVEGIQAGAEVNQNAFSNVLVGSTTIQADSKTDTLELVAGANIAITPDATNDRLTIAVTDKVPSAAVADTAVALVNARTINGVSFDGTQNITLDTARNLTTSSVESTSVDWNSLTSPGTYPKLMLGTQANGPGGGYYYVDVYVYAGAQITQLAIAYTGNILCIRNRYSGTWTAWKTFATTDQIPTSLPANGGNSDTCDGLNVNSTGVNNVANQIMRTNASGYAAFGWINTSAGGAETTAATNYYFDAGDGYIRKKTLANVKAELGIASAPADYVISQSLGATGWRKWNSGLIEQWGMLTNTTDGWITITFPISFLEFCSTANFTFITPTETAGNGFGGGPLTIRKIRTTSLEVGANVSWLNWKTLWYVSGK